MEYNMKIKVSHNSVELKLTLEEVDELQDIAEGARRNDLETPDITDRAKLLSKKLRDAKEAANKLNWMNGM